MSIKLRGLKNGECIQFFKAITTTISKNKVTYIELKQNIDPLLEHIQILDRTYSNSQSMWSSNHIKVKRLRIEVIKRMKSEIQGILYHRNAEIVGAIPLVKILVSDYEEEVVNTCYKSQIKYTDILIRALEQLEELSSVLSKLGLLKWVIHLKALNTVFKVMSQPHYINHTQYLTSVKVGREKAYVLYHRLMIHLKSCLNNTIEETEERLLFMELLTTINTIEKQFNHLILLRQKLRNADGEMGFDE